MKPGYTKLRESFLDYWIKRGHKPVPPAPLTLTEDPTTLFTSSGMQPLVPYLLGEFHPLGKRLGDIQPCIRTQDIEEVGDNSHDTFFEMMGNWSLGDYFKKEQLSWYLEFLLNVLKLPKEKLCMTVFEGNEMVSRDEEAASIWKNLGIPENRIYYYGVNENWWSRSGTPSQMPTGEIGGPSSEVFYEFTHVPHDKKYGESCHPNCQCGRFIEIGNSVFIQYRKKSDGTLEELPQKNVDFGGGVERTLAAINNDPDIFNTDVFNKVIKAVELVSGENYYEKENKPTMRIISDHIKAAVFLIVNGIIPSNKEHGYILRRLLRRAAVKLRSLNGSYKVEDFSLIGRSVLTTYGNIYFDITKDEITITKIISEEMNKFSKSLEKGLKEVEKIISHGKKVDGRVAFDLYQSYGFPLELTEEIVKEKGQEINHNEFQFEFNKHKEVSRNASGQMFKGGLADQSEQTVKYHTATHLLHQALFDIVGNEIKQEGSNITSERLRFDFFSPKRPDEDQLRQVEKIVNDKIQSSLPVNFEILNKEKAYEIGAKSFFREKYPDQVKVYYVGKNIKTAYSKEFCGGPHVKNTKDIEKLSIYKFERIGSNIYRIYAK